jgi:hypothetical protein
MIPKIGCLIFGFFIGRYSTNTDFDIIKYSKEYINFDKILKDKNRLVDEFSKEINKKN